MAKIPENINPFKIPENYFENFADSLSTKISEQNLKEKYGNKNPFTVPENYFLLTQKQIKNKIKTKNTITAKILPYVSVAALFIIIFGIWSILITKTENKNQSAIISKNQNKLTEKISAKQEINIEITKSESENIIASVDEYTVVEMISESKLPENQTETTISEESKALEYLADYADYQEIATIY